MLVIISELNHRMMSFFLSEAKSFHHVVCSLFTLLMTDCLLRYCLIVVIVETLVDKHQSDIVGSVDMPISKPRPKAVVSIYRLYTFIMRGKGKGI